MNLFKKGLVISLAAILLVSCTDDDEEESKFDYLVSYAEFFERSAADVKTLLTFSGLSELEDYIEYDITLYTIEYSTNYLGNEIVASGLVAIPETTDAVPMLSFQHGTSTDEDSAPSNSSDYSLLGGVAGAGYIFLAPDFIGFGSSSDILHPYYHADLTAGSVLDMVKATQEMANELGLNFNGDLYLAGYSEGGFATMAAHKALEETPLDDITLVASAPAAGGYDIKGMQEYFFSLETYHQPFYMPFVALSYESVYDWEVTMSDLFQEPYASALPGYFDGTLSGSEINERLTTVIEDFLTPEFLSGVDTDPLYNEVNNAFEENSVDDWVPQKTMIMYHGTADITVPYQNSVDVYEHMVDIGAGSNLTFISIQDATHGTGVTPYLIDFIEAFEEMQENIN